MDEKKEKIKKETEMEKFNENLLFNEDADIKEKIENEDYQSIKETAEIKNNLEVGTEEISIEVSLKEEIEQLRDEKLRLLAEMENLRKRSDRDRVDLIKYGSINLARDILSPDDNLTRALEAIPEEEEKTVEIVNLIDGLKMIQKEFATILEKYGVKKIDALNQKFNYNLHQAMIEIDNDEVEEGLVIQEMQKGYTIHDRLLRPSMVGVSKKPIKDDNKD